MTSSILGNYYDCVASELSLSAIHIFIEEFLCSRIVVWLSLKLVACTFYLSVSIENG